MVPRAFRFGGVLFLLLAAGLLLFGGMAVLRQQDRITRYQPASATIEKSELKVKRGRKNSTYTPIIEYSYEVNGQTYRGAQLLPMSENWSHTSAKDIVDRYPRGANTKAFYDPAAPQECFLEKHLAFQPYLICLLGIFAAAAGAIVWFSGRRKSGHQKDAEPQLAEGAEWWPLSPEYEVGRRLAKWRWATLAMIALAFIPFHYLISSWPDTGGFAFACGIVYTAVTLLFAALWAHASSVNRRFIDPIVILDRPDPMIGEEFTIRVTISVMKNVPRGEMHVGLLCREGYREKRGSKTQYGERTAYEQWLPPEPIEELGADGVVSLDFILSAPAGKPPSTDPALPTAVYPNYTWLICVKVKVKGGADLSSTYPVVIGNELAVTDDPAVPPPIPG